jgi:hypothetical protein
MHELDCCASVDRRLMLNASKMGVIQLATATRAGIVRESLSRLILCFLSNWQRGVATEYVSAGKTPVRILKRMDFRCDTILENGSIIIRTTNHLSKNALFT